jgi:hypothetical protein
MTSGLPLAAALPRRVGTFVAASAAAAVSLPVWLVFVGMVLLSVVRGGAVFVRSGSGRPRPTPNASESAPGGPR